jgi:hypothetical protein
MTLPTNKIFTLAAIAMLVLVIACGTDENQKGDVADIDG